MDNLIFKITHCKHSSTVINLKILKINIIIFQYYEHTDAYCINHGKFILIRTCVIAYLV